MAVSGQLCKGYELISSLSSATALTVPGEATWALFQAITKDGTFTCDGSTTPTSSVGQILYAGKDERPIPGNLADMKFIETAASATMRIQYFG